MKIELPCASAPVTSGPAASTRASTATMTVLTLIGCLLCLSVRKRPQAQLLLADLPEAREPVRLHDQEEEDEPAEHHQLDLFLQRDRQQEPHRVGRVGEEDRDEHDEGGAEERAEH